MRGAGEVQKKNSRTPINPKKYSCKGLKKIHTRNLITKKNSCGSKIPLPPPHNFSNGPSLSRFNWYFYYEGEGGGRKRQKRRGRKDISMWYGWVLTRATTLTTIQLLHLPQLVHLLRPLHLLHLVVIMTWVWCGTIYDVLHQFHIKG